jgi:hypothetical protein
MPTPSTLAFLAELFPQAQHQQLVDDQIAKMEIEPIRIHHAVRDFVSQVHSPRIGVEYCPQSRALIGCS